MSSVGSPTEVSTISIVMRPALGILAAPILAHVAVKLKQKKILKQILMKPTLYKIPIWNMIQIIFWKIYNAFLNKKKRNWLQQKKPTTFFIFWKIWTKVSLIDINGLDSLYTNIMHFFILFEFSVLLPTKSNFHFLIKDTKKFV